MHAQSLDPTNVGIEKAREFILAFGTILLVESPPAAMFEERLY